MFNLGCLSLIQVCFLPGFLLLPLFKFKKNIFSIILLTFSLSLIANFFLVLILTTLRAYNFYTIYGVFAIEIIVLIHMIRLKKTAIHTYFEAFHPGDHYTKLTFFEKAIFLFAVLISLYYFLFLAFTNTFSIFMSVDATFHWNPWAMEWFKNKFPTKTWDYPQLMPANWSITYQFMGSSVLGFFARFTTKLYSIGILLALFNLYVRLKDFSFIFGIITTVYLLHFIMGPFNFYGYAELPCAFMGFMAVYALLLSLKETKFETIKLYLWLGTILCSGAALTKQAGLYLVAVYLPLTYLLILHPLKKVSFKNKMKLILQMLVCILVLVGPWYLYKHIQFMLGYDHSENTGILKFFRHHTLTENFIHGLLLIYKTPKFMIWFTITGILAILGLYNRISRWVFLLITLPYFIIWCYFFSYDIRNIAFILPPLGLSAGYGTGLLWRFINKLYVKGRKLFWLLLLVLFVALAVGLNIRYTFKNLYKKQIELASHIGYININKILFAYSLSHKNDKGKIITNYLYLPHITGFQDRAINNRFTNQKKLAEVLRKEKPKYIFIIKNLIAEDVLRFKKREIPQYKLVNKFMKEKKPEKYIKKTILKNPAINGRYKVITNKGNIFFAKIYVK